MTALLSAWGAARRCVLQWDFRGSDAREESARISPARLIVSSALHNNMILTLADVVAGGRLPYLAECLPRSMLPLAA